MILCPNCNQAFKKKFGKLFCQEHGWHGQNEAGEIVPAAEPTDAEIEAAYKSKESDLPAITSPLENQAGPVPAQAANIENPPAVRLEYGDKVYYVFLAICGLTALGILGYTWYKNKQQRKVSGL